MNKRQPVLSMAMALLAPGGDGMHMQCAKLSGPVPSATVPVSNEPPTRCRRKLIRPWRNPSRPASEFTVTESELTSFLSENSRNQSAGR